MWKRLIATFVLLPTIFWLHLFVYEVWQPWICASQVSCGGSLIDGRWCILNSPPPLHRDHVSQGSQQGYEISPILWEMGFLWWVKLPQGLPAPHHPCGYSLRTTPKLPLSPSQKSGLHCGLRNLPGFSHSHPTFLHGHFFPINILYLIPSNPILAASQGMKTNKLGLKLRIQLLFCLSHI